MYLICIFSKVFTLFLIPLKRDDNLTPSPLGEGWEGGNQPKEPLI
jgi:hypothetical protein